MSESVLMSPKEAAALLGVQVHWLEKRRGKNGLPGGPPYVRMGGFVKYRRSDLDGYIENLPVGGGMGSGKIARMASDSLPEEAEPTDGPT